MDAYVRQLFEKSEVTPQTRIDALKGIGEYLYTRLKRGLNVRGDLTISKFVKKFRNKTSSEITEMLQLMLQNKRANQCVGTKYNSKSFKKYHTRDVNKRGYNVCVAILRYAKKNFEPQLTFGRLRNAVNQTKDTQHCGCLRKTQCQRNSSCMYKNRTCIPKNKRAIGFEGASRPGQIEAYTSPQRKTQILGYTTIPRNQRFYRDPDSVQDELLNHTNLKYVDFQGKLWRKSGKVVRSPI